MKNVKVHIDFDHIGNMIVTNMTTKEEIYIQQDVDLVCDDLDVEIYDSGIVDDPGYFS